LRSPIEHDIPDAGRLAKSAKVIRGGRMAQPPLWISEADVEALIDPLQLIAAIERGFRSLSSARVQEPDSLRIDGLDGETSYLSVFPAHDHDAGWSSVKVLAGRPANAKSGRPEIDAVVALVDPGQGRLAALIAARALTAYRTAAVTAASLKRLVGTGPLGIALVGTGAQARAHARTLAAALPVSRFVVASPRRGEGRAKIFAEEMGRLTGCHVEARPIPEAVEDCDAVVLMSLAPSPLPLPTLKDDCVLVSVGPFYPHAHEFDPGWLSRAIEVVSDHPERLRRQWAGSPLLNLAPLAVVGMGELLGRPPAEPQAGLRIVLSDGRGFEDNVAAALILEAARRSGRGLALP
jgi:alanine dehydrogenase